MASPSTTTRSNGSSVSLIASYIVDWLIIILIAIVGFIFRYIPQQHRYFDLHDATISFPFQRDTVSITTLVLVVLIAPALITALVALLLVPGPTAPRSLPAALRFRRRIWEWNAAWLGLALSAALSFLFTQGIKNIAGKPRPNMLARCQPDLDPASVSHWQVGGSGAGSLVGYGICRQQDRWTLDDGFQAFPSGHASLAWAGLAYLTLFLAAKFGVTVPYLLPGRYTSRAFPSHDTGAASTSSASAAGADRHASKLRNHQTSAPEFPVLRSSGAAPPTYLLALVLVPLGVATFIAVSRYADYQHNGFDILFGSALGLLTAWFAFRWYHAPARRGAGWAWAPRSAAKAWWAGLGVQGFGEEDLNGREEQVVEEDKNSWREDGRAVNGYETANGFETANGYETANGLGRTTAYHGMNGDAATREV